MQEPNPEQESPIEQRARQLETELSAFAWSVSHDLRAPLRIIDGFSEALEEEYRDGLDEKGLEYLSRIRGAAGRMNELLNALLELSRVSRDEIRRETVRLSEIAATIAADLRASDPGREVEFSIEPGVTAEGDPALLTRVLQNLLGNAWKFTSKKAAATIGFGAEEREGKRILWVRDDGAGFDPEYAGRLFGAFQRLHADSEFPGVGMGLAVVKRIIHRHGGSVRAEGKVGEGAIVRIELG